MSAVVMSSFMIIMPPKRFDYIPTTIPPIIVIDRATVQFRCSIGKHGKAKLRKKHGCWDRLKNKIWISSDLSPNQSWKVLRHEIGHINGWPQEK